MELSTMTGFDEKPSNTEANIPGNGDEATYYLPVMEDPHTKETLYKADRAAKTNATILITGETGVGKELIAKYIHEHSQNNQGPYVTVNCAALPGNMVEAILFGYEKGSFTSSVSQYIGKFEQAQNGTLLLDEVSEIPLELQGKLLRVLQEKEIERLGGRQTMSVNARIVAATNKDLSKQVMLGTFRSDLYYRLNVLPIHCRPLRERLHDIIPLAEYFITKYASSFNIERPTLSENAKQRLLNYSWPGNIRELDNIIQRILILVNNNIIGEQDIHLVDETLIEKSNEELDQTLKKINSKLKITEAKIIMDVLKEVNGSRCVAAKMLNMSPRTLRYKISKLKSIGVKVP